MCVLDGGSLLKNRKKKNNLDDNINDSTLGMDEHLEKMTHIMRHTK